MKCCENINCRIEIPTWTVIDGKKVNTQTRRFCFTCSPYKSHNTRDINKPKSDRRKRSGTEAVTKWRRKLKERIVNSLGGECQCCGYNKCNSALDPHHVNPDEKEMSLGNIRGHPRKWSVIVTELRKCILLCCRCHREVHAGMRTIPDTAKRFDERWVDYKTMEKEWLPPLDLNEETNSG